MVKLTSLILTLLSLPRLKKAPQRAISSLDEAQTRQPSNQFVPITSRQVNTMTLVIGYNCRFLQGSTTDRESVKRLNQRLRKEKRILKH